MCLRRIDKEFLYPPVCQELIKEQEQFPVLSKLARMFFVCPATSTLLEHVQSQNSQLVTSATVCQLAEVTFATIFLGENKEIRRKYYSKVVKEIYNPALVYMSVAGKAEELTMDVGQDLL